MSKTARTLWPTDQDDRLMEMVSEGMTFGQCATALQISRNAAIGRFTKLRLAMGRQAT